MRKKNKLKKKVSMNGIVIFFVSVIAILTVSVGYSYWTSQLNISGHVELNASEQPLEVSLSPTTGKRYVTLNFTSSKLHWNSDSYMENTLTTYLKAGSNFNNANSIKSIGTSFKMKNVSEYIFTDGSVRLVEIRNNDSLLTNPTVTLNTTNLAPGNSVTVTFSATTEKVKMNEQIYCKFDISYNVNGTIQHFYYMVDINF